MCPWCDGLGLEVERGGWPVSGWGGGKLLLCACCWSRNRSNCDKLSLTQHSHATPQTITDQHSHNPKSQAANGNSCWMLGRWVWHLHRRTHTSSTRVRDCQSPPISCAEYDCLCSFELLTFSGTSDVLYSRSHFPLSLPAPASFDSCHFDRFVAARLLEARWRLSPLTRVYDGSAWRMAAQSRPQRVSETKRSPTKSK
jgi:hypothetical protein